MKPLLFLSLCCFTTVYAVAQNTDSLKKLYNNQLLYRMGGGYVLGQEKISLTGLREQFSMSPEGLGLYKKGMRQYNTGRIITIGSLAFTAAAIASINRNNNNNTYLFLGGQLLTAIIGGQLRLSAQKLFDRAIWRRNRDLLFGAPY